MIGHELGEARRVIDEYHRVAFVCDCSCGLALMARTIPTIWARLYPLHLEAVRDQSRNNHPTRWENKP